MRALYIDIETALLPKTAPTLTASYLSPATAQVAYLTIYDLERTRGVIYQTTTTNRLGALPGNWEGKSGTEAEILRLLWAGVDDYDIILGFGIRRFDIPFVTQRSLHHGVSPKPLFKKARELVAQDFPKVLDLKDEFTFHSATPLSLPELAALYRPSIVTALLSHEAYQEALSDGDGNALGHHMIAKAELLEALFTTWQQQLVSPAVLNQLFPEAHS